MVTETIALRLKQPKREAPIMSITTQALWSNFQYAVVSYEENNADNTFLNTQCCRKQSLYCNIIYNKPTRCNSGSIVFIKNYKYALHVSDALCVHRQEHYKL